MAGRRYTQRVLLPGGGAVVNNKLYVIGGFQINVGMITGIWQFDPNAAAGAKWTAEGGRAAVPLGYVPAGEATTAMSTRPAARLGTAQLWQDSTYAYRYDPLCRHISARLQP